MIVILKTQITTTTTYASTNDSDDELAAIPVIDFDTTSDDCTLSKNVSDVS
jgi:hypothetical protein